MRYSSLNNFLTEGKDAYQKGPVALIFTEDDAEIESTLRHHLGCGFRSVVMFGATYHDLPPELEQMIIRVDHDMSGQNPAISVINSIIPNAPGVWFYYCYNAEYLFFPFCESRTIGEMLAFHTEERRSAMLTYVVDLYANDLKQHPLAVSIKDAHMDRSGYYALARNDPATNTPKERQLDFFGGLRWRFEEHVPPKSRKIDRIALFRAQAGLKLRDDHSFNNEEYNTYSCPWHHNLTAAICSFRTAKALKSNPGSTFDIQTFQWHNSIPFQWHSQQLMQLGLMEPGQWF